MAKRVLVAVDGTEASNKALEIACALADSYEAHLGLLCVVEPERITDDVVKGAIVEGILKENRGAQGDGFNNWFHSAGFASTGLASSGAAQHGANVARLANALADHVIAEAQAYTKDSSVKAIKTFVGSGDVAKEILNVAETNGADVIVMGHDQQGLLESLIKSSVAEKVVRDAKCPCLVYCLPKQG